MRWQPSPLKQIKKQYTHKINQCGDEMTIVIKNDKDLSKVNTYAKLYAENFYFDDEQWIYFNDLTKDIPLKEYNKDKSTYYCLKDVINAFKIK